MFNFSINTLMLQLMPRFQRGAKMLAWLQALLHPVTLLYSEFLAFRDESLYDAKITGQVEWLEYMLNQKFLGNGDSRVIYIDDNEKLEGEIYVFNKSELETETYIYNTSETTEDDTFVFNTSEGKGGVDFTVWVPTTLVFDADYMNSLIVRYKLAGTTFQIKTYH